MSPSFAGAELGRAAPHTLRFAVPDESHVGHARRAVHDLGVAIGLDETDVGRAALVVTEGATNAARHGQGGVVFARALRGTRGLEILICDAGPGIGRPDDAMRDGYSTGGTAGKGLGAMRRVADRFDWWSAPGAGVFLVAHILAQGASDERVGGCEVGAICVPLASEQVSGDAWTVIDGGGVVTAIVADGLGHGPEACVAAEAAMRAAAGAARRSPDELLPVLHTALQGTRGAAIGIAEFDTRERLLRFAGVGNIAARVVTGAETRALASHGGIVGAEMRRVQIFTTALQPGASLVMHSDGIASRWSLADLPRIIDRHPALAAAAIARTASRGRDDATVLVLRAVR